MTQQAPSLAEAKDQAKRLRIRLAQDGTDISHGKALEFIAHQYGFRDWNTLHAAIGNRPPVPWVVGAKVRGRYLSQAFEAEIVAVQQIQPGWFRLSLNLDEAVDVSAFQSMTILRKRVNGVVGPDGQTREKTSNGTPQLAVVHRR